MCVVFWSQDLQEFGLPICPHSSWSLVLELPARRYLVDRFAAGGAQAWGSTNLQRKPPVREIAHTSALRHSFKKRWLVAELLLLGGLVTTIALNYDPR